MLSASTGRVKLYFVLPGIRLEDTLCTRSPVNQVQHRFRLTSSNELQRVRRFGRSYAHPLIVLIAYKNELGISRFAVSAGRNVGIAVQRNRAKRLLREVVRSRMAEITPGWDILLLARQPIVAANIKQVEDAVVRLMQRARLIESLYEC